MTETGCPHGPYDPNDCSDCLKEVDAQKGYLKDAAKKLDKLTPKPKDRAAELADRLADWLTGNFYIEVGHYTIVDGLKLLILKWESELQQEAQEREAAFINKIHSELLKMGYNNPAHYILTALNIPNPSKILQERDERTIQQYREKPELCPLPQTDRTRNSALDEAVKAVCDYCRLGRIPVTASQVIPPLLGKSENLFHQLGADDEGEMHRIVCKASAILALKTKGEG